ncbi:hypothetical protein LINGRAHAP2_LOCUS33123 [Linum grandiflorum]
MQKAEDLFNLQLRLKAAELEIYELKQIRREDAKANEKVVRIFASQEQSWFTERKKLRLHIGALMNQLSSFQQEKEAAVSEFHGRVHEMEGLLEGKNKELEELGEKMKELEEKARRGESVEKELREAMRKEAQEHSSDLWKHKTAFLELVSNQRQLEAEMGRAMRQLESRRLELDSVVEQKEAANALTQKLSGEVVKLGRELEQKDKILSAMLRKSKADVAEKQMLFKELKLYKAKRKMAAAAVANAAASESRHDKHSLRNMFASSPPVSLQDRLHPGGYVFEYENPEFLNGSDMVSPFYDRYSPEGRAELASEVRRLEGWVRSEAEKYAAAVEKRHFLEIEAFVEQLRLKDEKLEAFQWKSLSTEMESKRLQSHLGALNQDMSQLRHANLKLEASFLKQQVMSQLEQHQQDAIEHRKSVGLDNQTEEADVEVHEVVQSPEKEFEEEKHVVTNQDEGSPSSVESIKSLATSSKALVINNTNGSAALKIDIHALGISYKIKRLKQQLLMLERLTGKQENGEYIGEQNGVKYFSMLISLLNRQISRYQTLEAKTDELCKRMVDNGVETRGENSSERSKGETKALEHFLDETFQLQRYMVATGQKLMEVQTKIGSELVEVPEELNKSESSINMKRFAENVRTLFQEVQRGMEVRISRIMGDLEGTLARQGMIRLRR